MDTARPKKKLSVVFATKMDTAQLSRQRPEKLTLCVESLSLESLDLKSGESVQKSRKSGHTKTWSQKSGNKVTKV